MKLFLTLFLAIVALFAFSSADTCDDMVCPYNYEPFCAQPINGGKAATYGNKCAIEVQECRDSQTIVMLVNLSYASPAKDPPKPLACQKGCKDDYTPLCAKPVDGKGTEITFGNNCVLENYNCEKADKPYARFAAGECAGKVPVRL
ncbi:unnamed protein product [Diamesa serratosioi]